MLFSLCSCSPRINSQMCGCVCESDTLRARSTFLSRCLPPAASCKPSARPCATGRRAGSRTTTPPCAERRIPRAASTSRSRGGQWGHPARRSDSLFKCTPPPNPLISFLSLNGFGLIRLMRVNEALWHSAGEIRSACVPRQVESPQMMREVMEAEKISPAAPNLRASRGALTPSISEQTQSSPCFSSEVNLFGAATAFEMIHQRHCWIVAGRTDLSA